MNITTRTGLLGFLLALSAFAATAAGSPPPATAHFDARFDAPSSASGPIEARLRRISAAFRDQQPGDGDGPSAAGIAIGAGQRDGNLLVAGFANGGGGGGFANGRYGGAAVGPGGGGFANGHAYYGGASRGFVNGGGGFVNGSSGGGGFVNAANAGFVNGAYRGGAFRNW